MGKAGWKEEDIIWYLHIEKREKIEVKQRHKTSKPIPVTASPAKIYLLNIPLKYHQLKLRLQIHAFMGVCDIPITIDPFYCYDQR